MTNEKLESIWNEAVKAKFRYCLGICHYEDLDVGGRIILRLILENRWYGLD
jgi:hypothetical protein